MAGQTAKEKTVHKQTGFTNLMVILLATVVLAMLGNARAGVDDAAVEHCLTLTHPSEERQVALTGEGTALPIGSKQVVGRTVGRSGKQVLYNVLSVPTEAEALCHSHPEDGGTIVPGPADWDAVKPWRPSYISHGGRLVKLTVDSVNRRKYYIIKGELTQRERKRFNKSAQLGQTVVEVYNAQKE